MRIAHFSDTHVGFTRFHATTEDGLNVRGEDVAKAFVQACDAIIALRPDLVIHSGDLWDSPRPSNRALALGEAAALRFQSEGIPAVWVAGNHDAPVQRDAGAPHLTLAAIRGVSVVFRAQYEVRLHETPAGVVAVHALPHCMSEDAYRAEVAKLEPHAAAVANVLVIHGSVPAMPEYRWARGTPQFIDEALFDDPRWDAVCLGHYHGATRWRPTAWYAGATERLTWNEVDHAPGFVVYDLTARDSTFHALEGLRPMRDLGGIDAADLSPQQITEAICLRLGDATRGAEMEPMLRLAVENVPRATWALVDQRAIDEQRTKALHVDINPTYAEAAAVAQQDSTEPTVAALDREWTRYVAEDSDPELVPLGIEYLRQGEAA